MNGQNELEKKACLLLEISSLLMVSGANTNRANTSIDRFASVLHCSSNSMISHKTLVMTLTDDRTSKSFTKVMSMPPYTVNFSVISSLSKSSWKAIEENWTYEQITIEVDRIKKQHRYPRILVLTAVSFAGAGFCNLFGGDYTNMLVAFVSTFVGLFILQEAHKKNFNVYFRVLIASFSASLVASLGVMYHIGGKPDIALATSILFLVPGVPLINSFTDLLDNNILNGLVRFTSGVMTVMAIAMGLFGALLIFQLS